MMMAGWRAVLRLCAGAACNGRESETKNSFSPLQIRLHAVLWSRGSNLSAAIFPNCRVQICIYDAAHGENRMATQTHQTPQLICGCFVYKLLFALFGQQHKSCARFRRRRQPGIRHMQTETQLTMHHLVAGSSNLIVRDQRPHTALCHTRGMHFELGWVRCAIRTGNPYCRRKIKIF